MFKSELDLKVIPNRNPLFVMLSSGEIRNGYEVKIYNKSAQNKSYKLEILGIKDIEVKVQNTTNQDLNNISVKNDDMVDVMIYVSAKKENLNQNSGKDKLEFVLTDIQTKELETKEAAFISSN